MSRFYVFIAPLRRGFFVEMRYPCEGQWPRTEPRATGYQYWCSIHGESRQTARRRISSELVVTGRLHLIGYPPLCVIDPVIIVAVRSNNRTNSLHSASSVSFATDID